MNFSGQNKSIKKGKGRQKVRMMKIESETNLQVTFSKRRAGVFKKASEISTLCGAETAIVVFSPRGKAYSFGHPNVDAVSNRFLNQTVPPMSDAEKLLEAHYKANIKQQAMELDQVESRLKLEQKRANELGRWCRPDINKLDYHQLNQLKSALLNFERELEIKVQKAKSGKLVKFDDPVVGDSCVTIPYSSTACTPSVDPNH